MELKRNSLSLALVVWSVALLSVTAQENPLISESSMTRCPKGVDYFPNPNYCTKYYQCVNGTPVSKDCLQGQVFRESMKDCVDAGSEHDTCTPAHPDRECKRHTVDLIPHPFRCQGYYNCSEYVPHEWNPWRNGYERECEFPLQFDIISKKCVSYKEVTCGQGCVEAKWQCDYHANECRENCRPCWVDYPSCVGKSDGLWPVPYASWIPLYMECKDERNLEGRLQCPEGNFFNPIERRCVQG